MPDRLYGVIGQWNLRKCNKEDCGVIWLDPMPLESELYKAYQSSVEITYSHYE